MTAKLPQKFLDNMKEMLGAEYQDYIKSMEMESATALRINTNKISIEDFRKLCPFEIAQVPWNPKGFYYDTHRDVPSKHPYYYAGLYYIQEPSAMIPAQLLPVNEEDRVLDLCAAPGGKATELAAKLHNTGLLIANDISVSRAMALAKNLQVAGARQAVVTAETPEHLARALPGYFDKLLIDAPCSGEGMFRREPAMVKSWLEHGPEYYARIQSEILESAYVLLKAGGYMVYSTCTFSTMEDEAVLQKYLDKHPDMEICEVTRYPEYSEGRPDLIENGREELKRCVRIFPHRAGGEGHFAALLHKSGGVEEHTMAESGTDRILGHTTEEVLDQQKSQHRKKGNKRKGSLNKSAKQDTEKEIREFQKNLSSQGTFSESTVGENMYRKKDTYLVGTQEIRDLSGLRIVSAGVIFGTDKKGRFEPSPQLALAMKKEDYIENINLMSSDERVIRYLKGETIQTDRPVKGYVLLCVDGFALGWCKGDGRGNLKNKYYPGWRMM